MVEQLFAEIVHSTIIKDHSVYYKSKLGSKNLVRKTFFCSQKIKFLVISPKKIPKKKHSKYQIEKTTH